MGLLGSKGKSFKGEPLAEYLDVSLEVRINGLEMGCFTYFTNG